MYENIDTFLNGMERSARETIVKNQIKIQEIIN